MVGKYEKCVGGDHRINDVYRNGFDIAKRRRCTCEFAGRPKMNTERKIALIFLVVFLGCWFLPVEYARFNTAILESLALVKWYAREHVILCLVPAFFIAGAIGTFISQDAVLR